MDNPPSMDDQFLEKIHQIIEANLDNENFSVEDLAWNTGLSRSMLHRKLIKLTGKSTRDFITEIRVTRAKEFLENDVATVAEVAYRVGFSDPSYFNKVFQKFFHISPGNVRKEHTANLIRSSTDRLPEIPQPTRSKTVRFYLKALVILVMISIVGGGVYYFFGVNRNTEKSVAVLPLHNLTGQTENAYFVDGMHDALIGELGKIESLRVISRTSTLRYRNSDKLLQDIAKELGVKTVVEGSVTGAGDSLKLIIQLIKVFPEERHLLVNEYEDDMHNALRIQRTAVKDIAQNIRIRLSEADEKLLAESRTVNPETYKDYLRGMYCLNQGTTEGFEKGIKYMHTAIARDPGDPLAYAGLAMGYAIMGHGMIAPEGSFRSAASAAERALRIDPTLDEAYTALALIYSYQLWDWPRVKKAFENAIANNPNNAIAHAHYAFYYVHFNAREKALYHANLAVTLEPLSASYHSWLAWLYYYYGEYNKAETSALKSLELNEDIPYGNLVLGWVYIKKKLYQQAIDIHNNLPEYGDYYKMLIGYTYIQSGNSEKALALWNEMEKTSKKEFVNPFHIGMLAGMLGYTDRAFDLFNEACDNKYYPITYIDIFPGIEALKDDSRYNDLLQRMNFPSYNTLLTAQE